MNLTLAIFAFCITAYLLMQVFFDSFDEFIEAIKFWLIPDIISWLRGQYEQDVWLSFKLLIMLAMSFGIAYAVYIKV